MTYIIGHLSRTKMQNEWKRAVASRLKVEIYTFCMCALLTRKCDVTNIVREILMYMHAGSVN